MKFGIIYDLVAELNHGFLEPLVCELKSGWVSSNFRDSSSFGSGEFHKLRSGAKPGGWPGWPRPPLLAEQRPNMSECVFGWYY